MPKLLQVKTKGFTLIELLVAISIISILSVVGAVSYKNIQSNAQDAKIKADLNAIKKAYETNYVVDSAHPQGAYQALKDSDFAGGKIPTQPNGSPYPCTIGPDPNCATKSDQTYNISSQLSDSTSITTSSNQGVNITATPTSSPTYVPTPTATSTRAAIQAPPSTDTSPGGYDMKVLVLKYFPLTSNGQNIDVNVTGDIGDPYTTIRQRTIDVDNSLMSSLQKGSSYLLYSNPQALPSLRYNIVDTKEYTQAVPFDPNNRRPLYSQILNNVNICDYVNNQGVNEVWMWAYQGPNNPAFGGNAYLSISESKMSGPFGDISNSYRGNDMPLCKHTYRLYVFNYGRGTAEAMESWGHQMEAELDAINSSLFRTAFQGPNYPQTLGVTGRCGSVHNPPNARFEYDRNNPTVSKSDCLNWNPDNIGQLSDISCQNWGCQGDPSLNYMIWMWQNLPGKNNTKTYQGNKLRNWWDIHGDFDNVMQNSKKLTL